MPPRAVLLVTPLRNCYETSSNRVASRLSRWKRVPLGEVGGGRSDVAGREQVTPLRRIGRMWVVSAPLRQPLDVSVRSVADAPAGLDPLVEMAGKVGKSRANAVPSTSQRSRR